MFESVMSAITGALLVPLAVLFGIIIVIVLVVLSVVGVILLAWFKLIEHLWKRSMRANTREDTV